MGPSMAHGYRTGSGGGDGGGDKFEGDKKTKIPMNTATRTNPFCSV